MRGTIIPFMVIAQAEAESILQPHLPRLTRAFHAGADHWRTVGAQLPTIARDVSRRGRSNLLYDFITAELEREFAGVASVQVRRSHGFLTVTFGTELVIRVKKFRDNRMYDTHGVATRQRRRWEQQLPLSGLPAAATAAVAGYLPDALGQGFAGMRVACRNGRFLEWAVEIPPAPPAAASPLQVPPAPGPIPSPVIRSTESARTRRAN